MELGSFRYPITYENLWITKRVILTYLLPARFRGTRCHNPDQIISRNDLFVSTVWSLHEARCGSRFTHWSFPRPSRNRPGKPPPRPRSDSDSTCHRDYTLDVPDTDAPSYRALRDPRYISPGALGGQRGSLPR